mgnify:CR=1 FL=1
MSAPTLPPRFRRSTAWRRASGLFFVGAGLSLIFGVTRIVNIAHGSLYMLGIYICLQHCATKVGGGLGFWGAILARRSSSRRHRCADRDCCCCARIYQAPELFQLLATFALLLVINDATLFDLGATRTCSGRGHRALRGSVEIARPPLPELRPVSRSPPARSFSSLLHLLLRQDPLRPTDPRRHAGPRDGRRARRQPGDAVHRRCSRCGAVLGRPRRRAAARARARQSRDWT